MRIFSTGWMKLNVAWQSLIAAVRVWLKTLGPIYDDLEHELQALKP